MMHRLCAGVANTSARMEAAGGPEPFIAFVLQCASMCFCVEGGNDVTLNAG